MRCRDAAGACCIGVLIAVAVIVWLPNPLDGLGHTTAARRVLAPEVVSSLVSMGKLKRSTSSAVSTLLDQLEAEGSGSTVQFSSDTGTAEDDTEGGAGGGNLTDISSYGPLSSLNTTLASAQSQPIPDWEFDIVYLWVNGSDPARQKAKRKFLKIKGVDDRDRDNGELRYSLRSLDKFLPWWNGTLYIVSTEVPCWLHKQHPRVRMVHHSEIFLDQDRTLPTFSSQAIEPNLHRIPGLRKHFILTNDDVFFGAPCSPGDFFRNGKPVLRFEKGRPSGGFKAAAANPPNLIWRGTMLRSRGMLEKYFKLQEAHIPADAPVGLFKFLKHAPAAADRDRWAKLWDLFPRQMQQSTHSRTRNPALGIHMAYVHHHFCLLSNADDCLVLDQGVSDSEAVFLTSGTSYDKLSATYEPILAERYKFWNINDEQDVAHVSVGANGVYRSFLPRVFPTRSQYETTICPPAPPGKSSRK